MRSYIIFEWQARHGGGQGGGTPTMEGIIARGGVSLSLSPSLSRGGGA